MIGITMRLASLPQPIAIFLHAIEEHDSAGLLATLSPDAVLIDGGQEHRGEAIGEWNDRHFLGANVTAYPINLSRRDGRIVLTVMVGGNHEGIGTTKPLQFDWWFAIAGDKICAPSGEDTLLIHARSLGRGQRLLKGKRAGDL